MSNYSQIYIQTVFAVRNRECLISNEWDVQLYKYITGIVQKKGQKMLAINGVSDHIHFFIGMKPSCCLSDLVREVKKASTEFIRENQFIKSKFHWQEGFGAFSYSHSHIDRVVKYVLNQKAHHKKESFKDEYYRFLKDYKVEYDEKYLFDWIE